MDILGAKQKGGKVFAYKKIRGLTDSEDETNDKDVVANQRSF